MIMKKIILFPLMAIILSFTNCSKPEEGGKDNPQPPTPPQEQITIPSTVDVKPVVSPKGGDTKITFTAAAAWTASVISTKADSWVDVNPKSGNPGAAEIKITVTPNDTYVERNATILISCGGVTIDIVVTQKQQDNITVTTDKVELGAEGGSFTIGLKTNIDFSYEIEGDWIKQVSTKAYTDKTLTFTAEANEGVQKREGSVTIKGGGFSETVKVYQSGEKPTLIITQNEYNLESEGGSIAVEVSSNVVVSMSIPENADWITENKTKSVSTSTFHLDVAENETYEARSAEITFSNKESGLFEKITVNQNGKAGIPDPEMIDLGLPSGLKWASFNVGAKKPEAYGGYYAWGETEEKNYYSWDTYKWGGNSSEYAVSKYCISAVGIVAIIDGLTILEPGDDVAHVKWGGSWRMPTQKEWEELIQYCTSEVVTLNGVRGKKFTGKRNGNSIFLPYAGYLQDDKSKDSSTDGLYWSSSLHSSEGYMSSMYGISFSINTKSVSKGVSIRSDGHTVRPVNYEYTVRVSGMSLNKSDMTLAEGSSEPLTSIFTPSNAYNQNVVWSSSNDDIATVDANGVVTAIKQGMATITVKSQDGGYTANCSVNVVSRESVIPEAVDLGLPSGLKWASFNVGATKPEEYGGYYAWGETEEKYYYDWDTYKWGGDSNDLFMSKYSINSLYGVADGLTILEPCDDVAHMKWGGSWRMPTYEDWEELIQYCTSEEATLNGVKGKKFSGKRNGNSIFLPYAGLLQDDKCKNSSESGFYWSSSLYPKGYQSDMWAYYFKIGSSGSVSVYTSCYMREYGFSVRPISE